MNAAPSREQLNETPCSPLEKPKVALVALVTSGGMALTTGLGVLLSCSHWTDAAALRFVAWSMARTARPCTPSAPPVTDFGLVHASQAPASTEHSYPTTSVAELAKETGTVVRAVGLVTGARTGLVGATRSTFQERETEPLVLARGAVARTAKVCRPDLTPATLYGLAQLRQADPSS